MNPEETFEDFLSSATSMEVAGVDTEVLIRGEGEPLLYLHGLSGLENSTALIDRLARNFKVYAPSVPGFGGTQLPAHFTGIDDAAIFCLDLLDALGIGRAVVAGFSFGGWLAAEMLVLDPQRASRLVLGAPLGLPTAHRREAHVTDIFMLSPAQLQEHMQYSAPPPPVDPATLSESQVERMVRNTAAASLYGWSPYVNNPKLPHRLHRVALPTLVLWGEDDRIAPLAYGQRFADALPNAELRPLAQCGHRIEIDQPSAAAQAIVNFACASAAIEEPAE